MLCVGIFGVYALFTYRVFGMKEKRVLMIASQEIVNNLSDGGKKVSNRNWKLLRDIFGDENAWLIEFDKNKLDDAKLELVTGIIILCPFKSKVDRICSVIKGQFFENSSCDDWVVEFVNKNKINIVFIDRTLFGNLAIKIKNDTNAQIWLFSHNLEKIYIANRFRKTLFLFKLMSQIAYSSEKEAVNSCDKLFVLTERDSLNYLEIYGKEADSIIPVSFEDKYNESEVVSINNIALGNPSKDLLFIGSYFNANYDGIKWFVDEIMPKLPDYRLKIVGKNFEIKKDELVRDNVEVIGTADNLEQFYYADNMMIMPIFYGTGQKVKTAEAMMYGKVIFATDEALEGYDVDGVTGIYRCNTKDEFINAIFKSEKENIHGFSEDVRALFTEKYSYEMALKKLRLECTKCT